MPRNQFAENTFWTLAGQLMRLGVQTAYFVLIARALGPNQYGAFVAVTAAAAIGGPFVGLGCGNLLVKNVSRDRSLFPLYWGNGLALTAMSGAFLAALLMLAGHVLLASSISRTVIVSVAISDLILIKVTDLAAFGFQAFETLRPTAALNLLASASRLAGIVALIAWTKSPTGKQWALMYLLASLLTAAVSYAWLTAARGKPKVDLIHARTDLLHGFYFSASASAFSIYTDIDKTMLARLASLEAAGIYAAAYRLIDIAFIPVRSLLSAAYPSMFRHGANGIAATIPYARRLLGKIAWYPLLGAIALFMGAPLAPRLLGHEYASTVGALRWLALIPLFKTLQFFAADAMTGANFQGTRTLIQVADALLNIGLNLWLVPRYSWLGAAWASLASDGLLAIALWCGAYVLLLKETKRLAPEPVPVPC